ncbi:Polysaccharide export outer membrane protein [Candidatus Electrothrix gigas]
MPNTPVESEQIIPASYLIGPSDELEISYYIDPGASVGHYLIDTEDILRIDFYYYPNLTKSVKVRPDGFITLPKTGDIKAVGKKPVELAEEITELFSQHLSRPTVTVELVEFNAKVKKLKEAVKTTKLGQAKYSIVRPDGMISLPYLEEDILASGKTLRALGKKLEKEYREHIRSISITVSLLKAASYQAYVLGEVKKVGYHDLSAPKTFLQLIAGAGGFTREANLRQIILIRRNQDGTPESMILNAEQIIEGKSTDPIIRQYDVVYVPSSFFSDATRVVDTIITLIPMRFSYSFDW